MTNSVTFPVDLGGDGSTVTDDDNASTGLGNGGHRTRFVPAMGQVVAVANVLTQRLSSHSDTSSSSIAIGTGSKSFVTAGFYEWAIGMYVMASSAASASNWMYGQVTAWNTSTNTVTVNVVSSNGSGTFSDWVVSLAGPANLSTLPSTIDVSSTSAALRVTQRGSGNSLLIEDSTNPDATPFVIASNGNVISGNTTAFAASTLTPGINFQGIGGSGNEPNTIGINAFGANSGGPVIYFGKSRGATVGTAGLVSDGDYFGALFFEGSDGVAQKRGASIVAQVDGTPGTNDMPGRLVFSTTADGASSSSEAMRIDSTGSVGIGGSGGAAFTLRCAKQITGATSAYSIASDATIQSDVTGTANLFYSAGRTTAAAFTLTNLRHFAADQGTIGAGSTVGTQSGFYVNASLTGATNNYGFYSNIASGTGRYNFYAAGTADNYFAGAVGIGTTSLTGYNFRVGGSATGATTAWGVASINTGQSDVTANFGAYYSQPSTQATAYTLSNLYHYNATQGTIGAGSTVTNQYSFFANSSNTGATNNYGFYSNIASGTGRYNFYAAGSASNVFNGSVGIGGEASSGYVFEISKALSGNSTGISASIRINPDATVTSGAFGVTTYAMNAVGASTPNVWHFNANQGTFSGTAPTNQYGFTATSGLIGATNNYGFYSNIASGSNRYNFYAAGTADNYFAGAIKGNTTIAGGYAALAQNTQAVALGSRKVTYVDINSAPVFTTTVSPAGSTATLIVYNSSASTQLIAWGTNFKTQGNISATALKTYTISFVSDGTTMIETSRTTGM